MDFLLEDGRGRLVAVEVKAGSSVAAGDVPPMRELTSRVGKRFHRGVLLYTGREIVGFGPNLHALPLQALWGQTK